MSSEQIKPGYKRTEVGVIPEDWDARKLGELAGFRTGPFGSALHKADYTNDGVPIVNPMHIVDGELTPTRTMTITESAATKLAEFRLSPGDVVIGRRGDMGRCAVVRQEHAGWLCGTGSMIVRPSAKVDARFLQRVLSSSTVISAIEESSVGSTMINLNQGTLRDLVIQAPDLHEQRSIATALSDVDVLLTKLDQLIAKKHDLKQATMQQLLTGQTRLPGFSEEWEMKRLGDVLRFQVGFPFSSIFFNQEGDGIRLIKNRDLKSDDQIFFFSSKFDEAFIVNDDDILIGMDGDFLPCLWKKGKALLNQRVGRILPSKNLNAVYSYYILSQHLKAIEYETSATTVKHLSHSDVEGIECVLPCFEEQTAIATVLSDMDAEIATLEFRRDKTRALKQGMMQELLTGRIRLV